MRDDDDAVVLNQPIALVIPNTTGIACLEFFWCDDTHTTATYERVPILAWRIESSRTMHHDHLSVVEPITIDELTEPWVYEVPGTFALWINPMDRMWTDFDAVLEWAKGQLTRSEQPKTQQ